MLTYKVITPKDFNSEAFPEAIQAEVERIAEDILLDFETYTATWKRQVKFEKLTNVSESVAEALVGTDDEVFRYVDEGTRPHAIRPKNPNGYLVFRMGGSPKTQPGWEISSQGQPATGPQVFSRGVQHPGTQARGFSKAMKKKWQIQFSKRCADALAAGRRNCGHAA